VDGRHTVELDAPPREALAALADAVEAWGGLWQGGIDGARVELPVVAGLRRGRLSGHVAVEPHGAGSRVAFTVEASRWSLHKPALAILGVGAAGGLVGLLWPWVPELAALAPLAAFFAFLAWFLVVARLRTSGPRELLDSLRTQAEERSPEAAVQ
jgi:hypothetical protein